jgi:hypothetical protein
MGGDDVKDAFVIVSEFGHSSVHVTRYIDFYLTIRT